MARLKPGAFRRKAARASAASPAALQPSAAGWAGRSAIALAAIVSFGRALPYPLQRTWDDGRFIVSNPDVLQPSWAALGRIFSRQHFEAYHPLHLLGYWLDAPWFGPVPWVLHATSLALWIIGLWFVYGALCRLMSQAPALLGSLAFGLHPIQVEAVSWATGRKDVLALVFAAASLWLHLRATGPWHRDAWLSRCCYVLAVLSKTTALPLPLLFFTLDLATGRARVRQALLWQLPSSVVAAAASVGVLWIWQDHDMVRTTLGGSELAPLRFVQTLGQQLLTAVWPARTSPMYETGRVAELDLAGTLAFLGWLGACWLAYRSRARLALAGLLGFAWLMLPVSNLIPMYFPLQDRYLSLPLLGLGLTFAALCQAGTQPERRATALVASLAVAALALRTLQYAGDWRSEASLWGHAASTHPDAEYAWLKLGEVRREQGQLEGAITAFQAAVQAAPLRKLSRAALFEVVALRDERAQRISPSAARKLAERYYAQLDDNSALQQFGRELLQRGYLRSVELALQVVLARSPVPDGALEQIAHSQLRDGRASLARFYVGSMREAPKDPELRALLQQPSLRVVP